ncbi:AzlD family protein [Roseibium aggregatum]|uniref:AzlD domain-containing protein n=1 Tax=Roseibium aggregatum TaxID=187304 RepID=A0A926NZJ3_9HYPH|nr:AzlD domain-containing protein [Roseibium aggregatum]MBD1546178.1 AzlD domain-containing protein [Roseibium aggregatum]
MTDAVFSVDGMFLLAIAGMTAVTYAMRAGGYWIMGRIPLTPRIHRALEALPGAIIVSTILPIALKGGVPVMLCLVVSAVVMAWVRKEFIAVVFAVGAAAAMRGYGL